MHHSRTTALMLCALFTAMISVSAFIRIPTPLVPITLQSGIVLLTGLLLGPKYGSISVLLYVLLGLCGVPVFTMGGGFGYVFQPTFGYLIGFILGAYITGKLAQSRANIGDKQLLAAIFCGLVIIYVVGTIYCYLISTFVLGTELAFLPLFVSCILLPLPGDVVLCILIWILGKRLRPHIKKYVL